LTIKGAAASNQGIDVVHANGNTVAQLIHGGTGDEGQLLLLDSNSTTVLIRGEVGATSYFNAGNVGIGTTSPGAPLDVRVTGDAKVFTLNNGNRGLDFTVTDSGALIGAYNTNDDIEIRTYGTVTNEIKLATSNTERARIDSSGRLLVGTSTSISNDGSESALQIAKATSSSTEQGFISLSMYPGTTNRNPRLYFNRSRGSSVGTNTVVAADDRLGEIYFNGADGTNLLTAASIAAVSDGTPGTNDMPGRLVFSTTADGASSPTERMRISNSGRTFIYSSAIGFTVGVAAAASTSTGDAIFTGTYSATAIATGTTSIRILSNGDLTNSNNSYGAISDIKLKENIVDANSQWDDLKALQVRNYNLKEGQTHTQIGLIAQEAELVSPGLVSESPDRDEDGNDLGTVTKSVNYSVLYMKAVKALQEAMERIETLEAKVAALESA